MSKQYSTGFPYLFDRQRIREQEVVQKIGGVRGRRGQGVLEVAAVLAIGVDCCCCCCGGVVVWWWWWGGWTGLRIG
jgi:hypothetical protein